MSKMSVEQTTTTDQHNAARAHTARDACSRLWPAGGGRNGWYSAGHVRHRLCGRVDRSALDTGLDGHTLLAGYALHSDQSRAEKDEPRGRREGLTCPGSGLRARRSFDLHNHHADIILPIPVERGPHQGRAGLLGLARCGRDDLLNTRVKYHLTGHRG
jgi:hypothetical protein